MFYISIKLGYNDGSIQIYCKFIEECYNVLALASVRYNDFEYTIYRDADATSNGFLISKGWVCK